MVLVQLINSICNLARLKRQIYGPEKQTWLAYAHLVMKDEKKIFFANDALTKYSVYSVC